jgi:hypothetical protein
LWSLPKAYNTDSRFGCLSLLIITSEIVIALLWCRARQNRLS